MEEQYYRIGRVTTNVRRQFDPVDWQAHRARRDRLVDPTVAPEALP